MTGWSSRITLRALALAVLAVSLVLPTTVGTSLAKFTSAATTAGSIAAGYWSTGDTFYLHDNGSGTAQVLETMNSTRGSRTLANYSLNCDPFATSQGRVIGGDTTTAPCDKGQWNSPQLTVSRRIDGDVQVYIWTAVGKPGKSNPPWETPGGSVAVSLWDVGPSGVIVGQIGGTITVGTGTVAAWQPGQATIHVTNYTVPNQHAVRLVLQGRGPNKNFVVYAAYDTTAYPARVVIP